MTLKTLSPLQSLCRYDLTTASWTNDVDIIENLDKGAQLPDIILVRKVKLYQLIVNVLRNPSSSFMI